MPKYTFRCNKCEYIITQTLSISEYLKYKDKECSECGDGVLSHQLGLFGRKIDRASHEIIADLKEEVQDTIKKIKAGDQRTIESIYGDKPNPYKS